MVAVAPPPPVIVVEAEARPVRSVVKVSLRAHPKEPRRRQFAHHSPPFRKARPLLLVERLAWPEDSPQALKAQRAPGQDALGVSVAKRRRHAVTGGHGRHGAG